MKEDLICNRNALIMIMIIIIMIRLQILFIFKVFLKLNGSKSDVFRFFRASPRKAYSSNSIIIKFGRSRNNHMNLKYIHSLIHSMIRKHLPSNAMWWTCKKDKPPNTMDFTLGNPIAISKQINESVGYLQIEHHDNQGLHSS